MLRFGIISELDPVKGVARVKFEEDDIVSDWLRISVPNTIKNKDEIPYDVNEPVWCIMDEHAETGVIAGSYYTDVNKPLVGDKDTRSVTFSDGTKVQYNRSTGKMLIDCVGSVTVRCVNAVVQADDAVQVDTPTATFTGDVVVEGEVSANGMTSSGDIEANGNMKAQGQVEALSGTPAVVRLSTHNHPTAPTGPVSPPTPGT